MNGPNLSPAMRRRDVIALAIVGLVVPAQGRAQQIGQADPSVDRLVLDMRIGGQENTSLALESVRHLSIGPQGHVYAADPQDCVIHVFDTDGRYVRKIGGRGFGPGEFQTITAIGWVGDTLWIADHQLSRISFITPKGVLAHTTRMPPSIIAGDERPARAVALLANRGILTTTDARPYETGEPAMQAVPILVRHATTSRTDTLSIINSTPTAILIHEGSRVLSLPFGIPRNNDRWAIAPDGSFIAVVRPYESDGHIIAFIVEAIDTAGNVFFRRRIDHSPIPLSTDERDRIHGSFAQNMMRATGVNRWTAVRRARQLLPLPTTRLAATYLFVGKDGRIWLHRRDESGVLTVIDPRNRGVTTRVLLPDQAYRGAGVEAADSEFLWVLERNPLGFAYIARYRGAAIGF